VVARRALASVYADEQTFLFATKALFGIV
jgi:hypothetical protein